ncbi:MAG: hypothetical protein ACKO14_04615 [Armatimonadota bacterium]
MKRRSGGRAGGSVLPGILLVITGVHGFFTWLLLNRVVHLEQQLGVRSSSIIPTVRIPTIKKPEIPRIGVSDWQIQLDAATAHVERARIAISKGNMGIARDESAKALETLTRISRMPAVDTDAVAAIRGQLSAIEGQLRGDSPASPAPKGPSK